VIEVAFLPYSASMWDSLESVYFAARDDEGTNAYVVPIPYYELRPNGKVKERCYDGDKFPKDIPVTHYSDYNLEERRPDIIFIHNFYDDKNLVTRVDESYYTRELRKHTNFLVGIYYGIRLWVWKDPSVIDYSAEADKHLPSVMNLDKLVTYSNEDNESMVHAWNWILKQYSEMEPLNFTDRFVAWGSPKFDINKNINNNRLDIPSDWKNKLYNANGGKKTVILFNTSLSPLLKNNEKYLDKLQKILDFFKERKDLVCLWRPHPLMTQTLRSMRIGLLYRYNQLVKGFLESENGIFDDTPGYQTAIKFSDAYYGDESSLVYLYLATGKPFGISKYSTANWAPLLTKDDKTFNRVLNWQIENMKKADGANIFNSNYCIWWDNFFDNNRPLEFLTCFTHYAANYADYPQTAEYTALKQAVFEKYVVNPDGTAGQKIYEHCKSEIARRGLI